MAAMAALAQLSPRLDPFAHLTHLSSSVQQAQSARMYGYGENFVGSMPMSSHQEYQPGDSGVHTQLAFPRTESLCSDGSDF
jgi:hypothetical protein